MLPGFATHVADGPSQVWSFKYGIETLNILLRRTFRAGRSAERLEANLTCLFRLALCYIDKRGHKDFWTWVQQDWGLMKRKLGTLPDVAEDVVGFYVRARHRHKEHLAKEEDSSPLAKLVDCWIGCSREAPAHDKWSETEWANYREAWVKLRDEHFDIVMRSTGFMGLDPLEELELIRKKAIV